MIEALLIFLCFFVYFGGKELCKYLEQRDYERRRFYLMVAEELDRLDKMTEETKQAERKSRNPSIWEMRN